MKWWACSLTIWRSVYLPNPMKRSTAGLVSRSEMPSPTMMVCEGFSSCLIFLMISSLPPLYVVG